MRGGRCSPAFHRICAGCALLPAALFVGTPTPPAPSAKDTRTLLPAPPPYPRLRQRIPVHSCRQPPPHPRLRRSSPAPTGGRGPCVAIPGGQPYPGWSQRAAVPGSSPAYSRILDRVDIATGGGAGGEGELVPPLSLTLQIPYLRRQPHPVRASVGIPIRFSPAPPLHPRPRRGTHALLPATPTPLVPSAKDTRALLPATPTRAFGAPPPPPPGGGVRAWRYLVGSRARFFAGLFPDTGPCGYRHGGRGRRGGGTCSPSPVSHAPDTLPPPAAPPRPRLRRDTHTLLAGPPTPPAPAALLPRPHRGRGPCVAISGEQPCPALLQDLPMLWTVGISPPGEGPTGRGNLFPLPCLSCSNHLTPLPAALFPPAIRAVPGRIPGGRQCPGSSAGAGFLEGQGR